MGWSWALWLCQGVFREVDLEANDSHAIAARGQPAAPIPGVLLEYDLCEGGEVDRQPARHLHVRRRARDMVEISSVIPELPPIVENSASWSRVICGAFARPNAIHVKEARASLLGLQRAGRREEERGSVITSISDNLSEVLAADKGRSADRELNAVLRKAAGELELGDMAWKRRHLQGVRNPADFDSRLANLGFLSPGECMHPRGLAGRLVLQGRPAGPVLSRSPPQLEDCARWTAALGGAPSIAPPPRPHHAGQRRHLPPFRAPAFLEVFSGKKAHLTGAIAQAGLRIAAPIDIENGKYMNVVEKAVADEIVSWIAGRKVWCVFLAPPCTRWTIARRATSTSPKDMDGLARALFTLRVIKTCFAHRIPLCH